MWIGANTGNKPISRYCVKVRPPSGPSVNTLLQATYPVSALIPNWEPPSPVSRRAVPRNLVPALKEAAANGRSLRALARQTGVCHETIRVTLKGLRATSGKGFRARDNRKGCAEAERLCKTTSPPCSIRGKTVVLSSKEAKHATNECIHEHGRMPNSCREKKC